MSAIQHQCLVMFTWLAVIGDGMATETPDIMGSPVSAKQHQMLMDTHFLPTRAEMTSFEMAEKLDLGLPQLTDVKKAYDAKDAAALDRSLAAYLRDKMGGMNIMPTGKPPREIPGRHTTKPEDWFKPEITINGFKMRIGERGEQMNFYSTFIEANCGPGIEWLIWVGPLTDAYIDTGDPRYVERMLDFTRAFYHRCRPPAERRNDWPWGGGGGPWSMGGSQRASANYLPYLYRVIGNSPVMTDADRVMFLKMFWEHCDMMHQFAQERVAWNFGPAHLYGHLIDLALNFPEFRDTSAWMKTVGQGFVNNMEDCILDDGGSVERTGYNFAFIGPYAAAYARLKDTPYALPETFRRGLERSMDFTLWALSPTLEYPLFGSSNLGPITSVLDWAVKIFPKRTDFAYALSGGKAGAPPDHLSRYLWHTGWLTMRSSWSTNALYMAMNVNGSPAESGNDCWGNLLSFGLWADCQPYMTDAGTTVSYSDPEYVAWDVHTRSCNTVMVDGKQQEHVTNGGRLENFVSMPEGAAPSAPRKRAASTEALTEQHPISLTPYHLRPPSGGFTYVAAVSDAYRKRGVTHRRAVLFGRPDYWLIYDVLTGDGEPHQYRWQGHFQPAEVKVDSATKGVSATPAGGNPLWLIPARPETFKLEQKSGPIITRVADPNIQAPLNPNRRIAPYVLLEKSEAVEPFAYTVLLAPSGTRPSMESLLVTANGVAVGDAKAIGVRVRDGDHDDLLAMSIAPAARRYGAEFASDGEAAYVRRDGKRLVEAGLVNGRVLEYAGKKLIEVGPDIASVHVNFTKEKPGVTAQGRGEVTVWTPAGGLASFFGRNKVTVGMGRSEPLTLTQPQFSTTPEDLGKAIGVAHPAPYKDMVAVSWQTSGPSDATIEYNGIRRTNPEPMAAHRFVLSPLESGKTYLLRITCRSESGAIGKLETSYTHKSP